MGRAIARRAAVTLFDEPTTNVEAHAKLALIRLQTAAKARPANDVMSPTIRRGNDACARSRRCATAGSTVRAAAELYDRPNSEFGGCPRNPGMNFLTRAAGRSRIRRRRRSVHTGGPQTGLDDSVSASGPNTSVSIAPACPTAYRRESCGGPWRSADSICSRSTWAGVASAKVSSAAAFRGLRRRSARTSSSYVPLNTRCFAVANGD